MRVAVDVMGGDHAPDAIIKGCVAALEHLDGDDRVVMVGVEKEINEVLDEIGGRDDRLVIHHAAQIIGMHESPVEAVKTKKDSSLVQMALLGSKKAEQRCDAVLSAGNTGACVSAATMHMRRLAGVHRPGIAVTMPSFHGPVMLCDAGANPEPRPSHLWQYGLMAEVVARKVHGIESPRVAVMNIGSEEGKGTDLIRSSHELLKTTPGINYIGYIEGRDFFDDAADVVVTDGFVGNTLLKVAEGLAKSIFSGIAQEIFSIDPDLALKFEPIFKQIYKRKDYHEYGGAPLLGVNGVCVISHGSSEAKSISSAIRLCKTFVSSGVNEGIIERLVSAEPVA